MPKSSPVRVLRLLAHFDSDATTASPALQSLQLRETTAEPLAAIHRLGLSDDYGLPPDLSGEHLATTFNERLPTLLANL